MTAPQLRSRASEPPHLSASTAAVASLRVLLDAVALAGGSAQVLLRRIGLPAEVARRRTGRIPFEALLRGWEIAAELVGDDAFGLHVGIGLPRGAFGLVEFAVRSSDTLRHATSRLVRYQRLVNDRIRFSLSLGGSQATLSAWIAGRPAGGPRHFNEALVASLVTLARQMTGVDLVPNEVRFPHAAPASTAEHRRILRCPVLFGARRIEVVVPRALFDLPLRSADPPLAAVLDECAGRAVESLPPASDGIRLCRELVASQLGAGSPPRIGYIARELAVSPRSLQRVLHAAGWSFRSIVDDVRRDLAVALASETAETAAQIAYRLGYADASAFHTAFRRWTGHTVSEVRRRKALAAMAER
jgi:AraC-like DNA-binding protein